MNSHASITLMAVMRSLKRKEIWTELGWERGEIGQINAKSEKALSHLNGYKAHMTTNNILREFRREWDSFYRYFFPSCKNPKCIIISCFIPQEDFLLWLLTQVS